MEESKGKDNYNLGEQRVIHKDNLKSMGINWNPYLSPIISRSTTWKLGPFIMELHTYPARTQRSLRRRSRGSRGGAGPLLPWSPAESACRSMMSYSSSCALHLVPYTNRQSMVTAASLPAAKFHTSFHMTILAQTI